MLIGIVFRGAAFAFRAYAPTEKEAQRWGRVFAIASSVTPPLLGIAIGAICSGRLNMDQPDFFGSWLHPFAFSVGIFTLILFAFLAAVYLTTETKDPVLQNDFRTRALIAALLAAPSALTVYLLARTGAPYIWRHLSSAGGPGHCNLQQRWLR